MYIAPEIINWLLIGGASVCAFMIGRELSFRKSDKVAEATIEYLYEYGYVKGKRLSDGDLEIFKIDEEIK